MLQITDTRKLKVLFPSYRVSSQSSNIRTVLVYHTKRI